MNEHKPTGTPNDSEYLHRTFDSMINSSNHKSPHHWGLLLDWAEAICYALVIAQKTGRKVRVISEQGGWLCYQTGKWIT